MYDPGAVGLYFWVVSLIAVPSLYQIKLFAFATRLLAVSREIIGADGFANFLIWTVSDEITQLATSVLVTNNIALSLKVLLVPLVLSILGPEYHLNLSSLFTFVIFNFILSPEQNVKLDVLFYNIP